MNTSMARMAWACGAAVLLAGGPAALGQAGSGRDDPGAKPAPGQPTAAAPRVTKSVRQPVVDLLEMSKDRRPGQVLPGDPAPYGSAAASQTPDVPAPLPAGATTGGAEAAPGMPKPSITLPDTAPGSKPQIRPLAETGARPAAGTNGRGIAGARATAEPGASAMVDGAVVSSVPAALSTGPAKVRVESIVGAASGMQWKSGAEEWKTPAVGQTVEGIIEARVGLDGELVLVVDDRARVRVSRLGRVTIERCAEEGGGATASVNVARGAVEVRPAGMGPAGGHGLYARVRTPDQGFGLTGALRIEYDAFTGTRRRVVNP